MLRPSNRRLAPQVSPGTPAARVFTAEVTAVNTTTRTVTLDVGGADIKVGYPFSLGTPAVGDVMWCLDSSGHYWPIGFNR